MPKTLLQTRPMDVLALAADLRYALDAMPREPDPETGAYQLDDRTANYVYIGMETSVSLLFPASDENHVRDFFLRIDSSSSASGNVSLMLDPDEVYAIFTPDGNIPDVPLGKTTLLYFSEAMGTGMFLMRAETLESATLTQEGD